MHKTTAWDEVEEAWEKALLEGKVLGSRGIVLRLSRLRFGEPDDKTEAALSAIVDPDRLDRMGDAILTVKSWKALLAVK